MTQRRRTRRVVASRCVSSSWVLAKRDLPPRCNRGQEGAQPTVQRELELLLDACRQVGAKTLHVHRSHASTSSRERYPERPFSLSEGLARTGRDRHGHQRQPHQLGACERHELNVRNLNFRYCKKVTRKCSAAVVIDCVGTRYDRTPT